MKKIGLFIGLVLSVVSVIGVYAATITNATYYGNLQITNNGSAATNQFATFTLNTTTLINAGFINSSLNNTAILNDAGADTPFMPGFNGSNPWAVWVSSITAGVGGGNATLPYTLYTGGNQSMASNLRYFPGAAGMNATDNASLELGGNFTINQTAFIDTSAGANKTLVYKPGAITTNTSGGNITTTASVNATLTLYPTANDTSTWTVFGANTSQQAILTNDGNTSYIRNVFSGGGTNNGTWSSNGSSYTLNGTIAYVRIYAYLSSNATGGVGSQYAQFFLQGVAVSGQLALTNGTWVSSNYTQFTDPLGGAWTWSDIQNITFGLYSVEAVGYEARCTQIYLEVNYAQDHVITSTSVASGNHSVATTIASGNITNYIDGVRNGTVTLNGTGIVDTPNEWQFFTANATPYVSNMTITINGTQQGRWEWQYGTTFTDLTGNGHTATPTFRTAGSSSNVTANLTTYTPYTQSTSTPTSPNASAGNITIAFTQPPNLYSELNITMPGAVWWNGVLDGANIPRAIFWFPWLFGWTCLIGLAIHWLTKSLLVQGLVMAFLLVLFSLMGGFGYWVAIEFIILAMAFIIGEKQYGF